MTNFSAPHTYQSKGNDDHNLQYKYRSHNSDGYDCSEWYDRRSRIVGFGAVQQLEKEWDGRSQG
jgi:hypothetical protein